MQHPNALIIHARDSVAVALEPIPQGRTVHLPDGTSFPARSDIPYSHKVALHDIAPGQDVLKYGEVIGTAKAAIARGEWVHTHNLDIESGGGA